MNTTTETPTDFDVAIAEVDTNGDLDGAKIERLLFEAGYDSEQKEGYEGIPVLEVKGDYATIIMSEPWSKAGDWYIDPKAITLDKFVGDAAIVSEFHSVKDEAELVRIIETLADRID